MSAEPVAFEVERSGAALRGESAGEGPPIALCTASPRPAAYVVHGSRALGGRACGRSPTTPAGTASPTRPRPARATATGALVADLGGSSPSRRGAGRFVLAGHSMGAHTLTALRARQPRPGGGRWSRSGRCTSGARRPTSRSPTGTRSPTGSSAAGWRGSSTPIDHEPRPGVARHDPADHPRADGACTATRRRWPRRCARCRARARSSRSSELEFLDVPALVVASHDDADPGHPYAVAEAWAERLPRRDAGQRGGGRLAARLAGRPALARDRRVLRAARGRRAPRGLSAWRSRRRYDEPQARPGLVDRADLVVDQPDRERELADDVLGQVGRHARRPLRPGDPQPAGRVDRLRERLAGGARARRARAKKATTTSSGPTARALDLHVVGGGRARRRTPAARSGTRPAPWLDPELSRQRGGE